MLCDAGRSGRAKGRRAEANGHVKKNGNRSAPVFFREPFGSAAVLEAAGVFVSALAVAT